MFIRFCFGNSARRSSSQFSVLGSQFSVSWLSVFALLGFLIWDWVDFFSYSNIALAGGSCDYAFGGAHGNFLSRSGGLAEGNGVCRRDLSSYSHFSERGVVRAH